MNFELSLFIVSLLFISVFSQFNRPNWHNPQVSSSIFNPSHSSTIYAPPQSIGGGMMSQGGYIKVQNTYHAPQSIGGGMMSHGGWTQTEIKPINPVIQTIIDIATLTAGGHKSNNKYA